MMRSETHDRASYEALTAELEACRCKLAKLEAMNPYFKLIESNIHDVLAIMDMDLNRLYISPSVYWQRGFTVEEVLDTPLEDQVDPASMDLIRRTLRSVLADLPNQPVDRPVIRRLELVMYRKDGSSMTTESDVSLHLDADGNPAFLVSATRDITQRKKMEQALRESENRYRALFTDTLEALSIVKDGVIMNVNSPWLKLHGYETREEVVGRSILDFIHPSDHVSMDARRNIEFDSDLPRIYEMVDRRKDGTPVHVEVKSNTIILDGKAHILSSVRDMTQTVQARNQAAAAHEALREKTRELEMANSELSRYAFAVSHELKSPVRSAYSLIQLLADDSRAQFTREQRRYIDGTRQALENLRTTIEGMLELTRISNTAQPLAPIHIKVIIPEVFRRVQTMDGELDLPVEWPVVLGEPLLLTQVFSNLVSNGFKFNQSRRKRVRISWKNTDPDWVEITISDNGIGIEPEYIETIFTSFKRLHTREKFEGSGIGLTIVQQAVFRMKGLIRVDSTPGKGTAFKIRLKRAALSATR